MHRIISPLLVGLVSVASGCGIVQGTGLGLGASGEGSQQPAPLERSRPSMLESSATKAWRAALSAKGDAILDFYRQQKDLPRPKSTSPSQHAADALAMLRNDQLADVAAECEKGSYDGEALEFDESRQYLKASVMCPLIIRRKELLEEVAYAWAVFELEDRLTQEAEYIARVEARGLVPVTWIVESRSAQDLKNYVLAFVSKTLNEVGRAAPNDTLSKGDELHQRRQRLITKLATTSRLPRAAKPDPAIVRTVTDSLSEKFDVQRVLIQDGEWRLEKNDLGRVLRRYKNLSVMVRAKDRSFCALVGATISQQYEDMGIYERGHSVRSATEGAPVRCR